VDNSVVCHADVSVTGQSVTCGTVTHMRAHQQAWVETSMNLFQYGTHFTGFLISAD
jgi:hypothetical protein